jgi:hypothetical protein
MMSYPEHREVCVSITVLDPLKVVTTSYLELLKNLNVGAKGSGGGQGFQYSPALRKIGGRRSTFNKYGTRAEGRRKRLREC